MWFKKKSVLLAEHHYDTEKSADGITDLRTKNKNDFNTISSSVLPSAADAGKYFYLPFLGLYDNGELVRVGFTGNYWSSSAFPAFSGLRAYGIIISGGNIFLGNGYYRVNGFRVDWPD